MGLSAETALLKCLLALPALCSPGSPEGCNDVQLLEHGSLQTPNAGLDARATHAAKDGQDWRVINCLKSLVTQFPLSVFRCESRHKRNHVLGLSLSIACFIQDLSNICGDESQDTQADRIYASCSKHDLSLLMKRVALAS